MDQLIRDLTYSWRTLRASPLFAATTVGTLAVGLALVAVVFTVFNAYVLRPYAVRDPYSLHEIRWKSRDAGGRAFRWQDYDELRNRGDLFTSVFAERNQPVMSSGQPLVAAFVSGNFFESLGGRIELGRTLASFDAPAPGGNPVAVLSHQGWTRLFDRDPSALGRELPLNGERVTIVGIMGESFSGVNDTPPDVWVPLTLYPTLLKQDLFGADQPRELAIVARLRPGVTAEHTQAALTPFMARAVGRTDGVRADILPEATPAPLTLELLAILSPVFAAFGLVLLTACANVSSIMFARATARQREIGLRLSLGASRGRVIRQLLTEGFVLASLAGVAGLALAALLLKAGLALFLASLPTSVSGAAHVLPLTFDHRVFTFTLLAAGGATILFALLPALQASRLTLTAVLRGEFTAGLRSSRWRSLLVAGQVAVSLVLLIVAATLVRASLQAADTDLGFATSGLISINQRTLGNELIAKAVPMLVDDPRIGAVVVTSGNPLFGELPKAPLRTRASSGVVATSYMHVSPDYFSTLGIALARGRGFAPDEARSEARVGIISAAGARRLWPGADPIGQTVRVWVGPEGSAVSHQEGAASTSADAADAGLDVTIVGVAADVVSGLVYAGKDAAHLYLPTSVGAPNGHAILLRGRPGIELRPGMLQPVFDRLHANPFAFEAVTLDERLALQMFPVRMASSISLLLGGIALALSVSGLYGAVAYALSQRWKEMGIRVALGATSAMVVGLLMRQAGRLVAAGTAVGLVVALGALAALRALVRLDNVTLLDAGAVVAATALVAAAAALATYLPARRAAEIAPSDTLRGDG